VLAEGGEHAEPHAGTTVRRVAFGGCPERDADADEDDESRQHLRPVGRMSQCLIFKDERERRRKALGEQHREADADAGQGVEEGDVADPEPEHAAEDQPAPAGAEWMPVAERDE